MRRFFACCFVFWSTALFAESTIEFERSHLAGYCSAYTQSGLWGVWFGNGSVGDACYRVERGLAPEWPTRRRSGYYNRFGWNNVRVSCLNYSGRFSGYGANPGSQAYNAALWANGQYCLFSVNY